MVTSKYIMKVRSAGLSMYPFIKPNNGLIVSLRNKKYELGDIVVFIKKGQICSHRIVRIIKNRKQMKIITKGDNNYFIDGKFSPSFFLGKVEKIETASGYINLNSRLYYYVLKRFLSYFSIVSLWLPSLFNLKKISEKKVLKWFARYLLVSKSK